MVGICSYLLVNFWYTRIAANQSSISALLTNRVGDCFLTIGMFAIFWSFGNCETMLDNLFFFGIVNKNTSNLPNGQVRKKSDISLFLGSYLAGLIEGDGYIAVHDKNSKSKKYRPKIIIVFSLADKPLAEKLSSILQAGKVISKPNVGHVLWQILAKEEVIKIINLINGYMRTPKIEALHRAICWINENDNSSIDCLDLDLSPIDSNSWLAGFTDADGNFSITLSDRKKNGKVLRTSLQTFFRIEVKQNSQREVTEKQEGNNYFNILTKISAFFTVNLYTRTRNVGDKVYYSYIVVAHNSRSHQIVRSYFDRFPLYSSKYLAYKDWCEAVNFKNMNKNSLDPKELDSIKIIQQRFKNRVSYNWKHLDLLQNLNTKMN